MFSERIKTHRERLGYTQSKLSALSGISLPTIQNIEANRANPALETMERLMHSLGMEVQYVARKADWDFLSLCGVPLLNLKSLDAICTKEKFIAEMRLAIFECENIKEERKRKAIGATLLALRTHYPLIYDEFARVKMVKKLIEMDGLLKLRRIALEGLARIL